MTEDPILGFCDLSALKVSGCGFLLEKTAVFSVNSWCSLTSYWAVLPIDSKLLPTNPELKVAEEGGWIVDLYIAVCGGTKFC